MKRLNIFMVPCISVVVLATLFQTGLRGIRNMHTDPYSAEYGGTGPHGRITEEDVRRWLGKGRRLA